MSFLDLIRLVPVQGDAGASSSSSSSSSSPLHFRTAIPPLTLGNPTGSAYGGCALAVAMAAGFHSMSSRSDSDNLSPYSLTGVFLSPASWEIPFEVYVSVARETRTFATRVVRLAQKLPEKGGVERDCLLATVDFITTPKEGDERDSTMVTYCAPPSRTVSHHSQIPAIEEMQNELARKKGWDKDLVEAIQSIAQPMHDIIETKQTPEGILGQNLHGAFSETETTQDSLHITDKRSWAWVRSVDSLEPTQSEEGATTPSRRAAHASLVAFLLDSSLSFLPTVFSRLDLSNASAQATLDFALRFHTQEVNLSGWHLHEIRTNAAGVERSFQEARLWDEEGRLQASMSQACVNRGYAKGSRL